MLDYLLALIFCCGCLTPLLIIGSHDENIDPASRLGGYRWLFIRATQKELIASIENKVTLTKRYFILAGSFGALLGVGLSLWFQTSDGLLCWALGFFTGIFWYKWAAKYVSFYGRIYRLHKELFYHSATKEDLVATDVWLKVVKVIKYKETDVYITDVPLPDDYTPFYYHVDYHPNIGSRPVYEMLICTHKLIDHDLFESQEFISAVLNKALQIPEIFTGRVSFIPVRPDKSMYKTK